MDIMKNNLYKKSIEAYNLMSGCIDLNIIYDFLFDVCTWDDIKPAELALTYDNNTLRVGENFYLQTFPVIKQLNIEVVKIETCVGFYKVSFAFKIDKHEDVSHIIDGLKRVMQKHNNDYISFSIYMKNSNKIWYVDPLNPSCVKSMGKYMVELLRL